MSAKTQHAADVGRRDLWIGGQYVAPFLGRVL